MLKKEESLVDGKHFGLPPPFIKNQNIILNLCIVKIQSNLILKKIRDIVYLQDPIEKDRHRERNRVRDREGE